LTKDTVKLETRLRHIDIHQHWLRQEVEDGTITIKWLPITQMPADGLTKALPAQKHARPTFLRQLKLIVFSKELGDNHGDGGTTTPESDHGQRAAGNDDEEEEEGGGGRFAYSGVF
jgi:hypothetical protein